MYKTLIKFTIGEYSFKDYLKVKSWINLSEEDGATRKIFLGIGWIHLKTMRRKPGP